MKKKIIIDFCIFFAIGLAIWLLAFFLKQPYQAETTKDMYRYSSDSFIIPGIVLICIYLLSIVAHKGFFDGISYSFRFIIGKFIPTRMSKESYYDYKQAKKEKRQEVRLGGLLAGIFYTSIAIIFYILYYCV